MVTSLNGAVSQAFNAFVTREALARRIRKSRPIVRVHIEELDDPEDLEQPEGWVLMQAMSNGLKEAWSLRLIANDRYEPDEELRKERDRQKTYGQMFKGQKVSLVACSVVDEDGQPLWSEGDVSDLDEANTAAIERLYAKAVQLNGLDRTNLAPHLREWLEQDEHRGPAPVDVDYHLKNSPNDPSSAS